MSIKLVKAIFKIFSKLLVGPERFTKFDLSGPTVMALPPIGPERPSPPYSTTAPVSLQLTFALDRRHYNLKIEIIRLFQPATPSHVQERKLLVYERGMIQKLELNKTI